MKIGTRIAVEIVSDNEVKVELNGNGMDIVRTLALLLTNISREFGVGEKELLDDIHTEQSNLQISEQTTDQVIRGNVQ